MTATPIHDRIVATDGDHYIPPPEEGLEFFRGGDSKFAELYPSVMQMRLDFVHAMGWFDPSTHTDDTDQYDGRPETVYITRRHDRQEGGSDDSLAASMRLTSVLTPLEDALSVEMIKSQPSGEMMERFLASPQYGALHGAARESRLFDLTRFVINLRQPPSEKQVYRAMLEMIGAGIELTCPAGGPNVVWVFTEGEMMNRVLDRYGIVHERVVTGIISPDKDREESSLCMAYPLSALRHVQSNPQKYAETIEGVTTGIVTVQDRLS
jgi:N-acyl-L-homoserine lactone synthetase